MRTVPVLPQVHFFVCGNRRDTSSALGAGCGAAGDAVYDALKEEVGRSAAVRSVWVTKTHCLGVCPRQGCTVAAYPRARIWADVEAKDVPALFAVATKALQGRWTEALGLVETMEANQRRKVFELARGLKPGITHEDMQSPHDFSELADKEWHFEDGVLAGIRRVLSAVRGLRREDT